MTEVEETTPSQQPSRKLTLDSGDSWELPASLNVPDGSTFFLGDDDGFCRAILPERGRCQGVRTKAHGLCPGHAGSSVLLDDPRGFQRKSAAGKVRARERRALLARNGITPRTAAREAAIARTDAVVRALVDEPLDDPNLSTMQRQRAVLGMLDAVFPLTHVSAEIELPASADGVESLSWSDMQRIALQLEGGAQGE